MKYNDRTLTKKLFTFYISLVMLTFVVSIGETNAFADENTVNEFTIVSDVNLNDPMIATILENIEKSKEEFSDFQQKSDEEKLIGEQRRIAQNMLEHELQRMFKDNEEFTPIASFNKFLKTMSDENTKIIFTGLFDYKEKKVNAARNALHEVIKNGGTLQEARHAYHEAAKIPRTEMIQLAKELNIKLGFSDPEIQKYFNDQGKLPRYDNEQESALKFIDLTTTKNVNSSMNSAELQDNAQNKTLDEFRKQCEPQFGDRCIELYEKRNIVETKIQEDDLQNKTLDEFRKQCEPQFGDRCIELYEKRNIVETKIQEDDLQNKTLDEFRKQCEPQFGDRCIELYEKRNIVETKIQEDDLQNKTLDEFRKQCEPQFGDRCIELYEKRNIVETKIQEDDLQNKTLDEFRKQCEPQFGDRCIELYEKRNIVETKIQEDDLQTVESLIIRQLLEEIQVLENRIQELEKQQGTTIQKTMFKQQNSISIQYADWISDYSQGKGDRQAEIDIKKSIIVNALNKPNSQKDINNSLALGRHGQIILGFSEPVTGKLIVYEATKEINITERATIEVSVDGKNWTSLNRTQYYDDGSFVDEYRYDLVGVDCIEYVRITDVTPGFWGDGFDVDAVGATQTCINHS